MPFDIEATKARIERMVSLLGAPLDVESDYLRRLDKANGCDVLDDWRKEWLAYFEALSERISDPGESTDNDSHHLLRWMDWDLLLSEAGGELPQLASQIQAGLRER